MKRRSGLAALAAIAVSSAVAACSSNKPAAPSGNWQRDGDGNLLVAIPKGWEKSTPDSGAWTTCWTDPEDDSNVLMTTSSIDEDDVYTALDTSADAARSVTRGYRLVGECTAWSDGTTTLARQDYQTTWPVEGRGSTWAISSNGLIALVDLSGSSVTDEQFTTVGSWIELTGTASATASITSSATVSPGTDGSQYIEVSGLSCALPEDWTDTGALEGSERWVSTGALVEDEIMAQRLFLAPTMPQSTVTDAMSQIENDSSGGALVNYTKQQENSLHLSGLTEAIRTDFSAGDNNTDEGCIWVLRQDSHVAAVQYSGTGPIDTDLRDSIEQSLALTV